MLKKFGNIILALLLVLTTSGMVISKHYCGNMLVSISIDSQAKQCCDGRDNHCCHNKNETLILKAEFTYQVVIEPNITYFKIFGTEFADLLNEFPNSALPAFIIADPSPPPGIHLFLARIQAYLL
jgi:hypothetical protein